MRPNTSIVCENFPCTDVQHACYSIPGVDIDPGRIMILLISEAAPPDSNDNYYADGNPLFAQTTLAAFHDAGVKAASIPELLEMGVYLTTAIKCGKTGYGIARQSIANCSLILEQELDLFPNVKAYLLMGDVAIQAVNMIAKRSGAARVIPAGSTYKIRGGQFTFRGGRAFPSYTQAGPSFFIEKSKRRAIAEDIAAALAVVPVGRS